jgi:MYXO-CTERM domain-containing protein
MVMKSSARRWKALIIIGSLGFAIFAVAHAPRAVVNQINGQVVPVTINTPCPSATVWAGCIQSGLDYGEGINPPGSSPSTVDAILDANTGPETFLVPTLANGDFATVRVALIQEGAGFENIFGWYNVGEPNRRFPLVFSCRGGNRSAYEAPTDQGGGVRGGGYTITIDFEAEFTANRYRGKQIGFYLVTPEGSPNRNSGDAYNNCATDPNDLGTIANGGVSIDDDGNGTATDLEGFGRVYFTENKLNNDGNYVHYLVYQSAADAEDYYFAFEDLFRGGDNDYEDTMVKVEGLVPTCIPSQEICNGEDDNCNGVADENVFRACSSACGSGQQACQFTNDGNPNNDWGTCNAPQPQTETCNGVDDDCNGQVDDGLVGTPCTANGCVGTNVCQSGAWVCDAPTPTTEICDGIDNDCNNQIDDGVTRQCSSACGTGTERCSFSNDGNPNNDWTGCTAPQPTTEICNGKDDDCNGAIDDALPGTGAACTGANNCPGQRRCVAGSWTCDAAAPQAEICDGIDNDCNGKIDDNISRSCTTACGTGSETCQFSDDGNPNNDWVGCTAPLPSPELCNGKDDDCNGAIDDGIASPGACTGTGGCPGTRECQGGKFVCLAPQPTTEICDGKDNNCNGRIDEGVSRACSSLCGIGVETCQFSDDGNSANDWVGCTATLPQTETCNGKDDDCDGAIDNNLPPGKQCTIGGCLGKERCTGGKWVCDAPIPGEEICDGLDNNCDGKIDENLTRACSTACGLGAETCQFTDDGDPTNDWAGCTAQKPQAEICDGVDNDCNGQVDDNVPGVGGPCDHASGSTCQKGETKCVGGKLTCVGATTGSKEICDCKDNDCDGDVDEGDLCSQGTKCLACGCRIPCAGGEFGCPKGFVCSSGYCVPDKCDGVTCPPGERCFNGECKDPCVNINCPPGDVCQQGICVADNCYGNGCPDGQICVQNQCVKNPCAGVSCKSNEYCKDGKCLPSCGAASCGADGLCVDGKCVENPCADVTCDSGVKCVDGKCDSDCLNKNCGLGRVCKKGVCVDDPCTGVVCPQGEACREGQCISSTTYVGETSRVFASGSGGVACRVGDDEGASPPWMLLLLGLVGVVRSQRRRRSQREGGGAA